MLLCGRARGVQVGPSGSSTYFERLRWAMQDSPPNIVTLLARVADKKLILATQTPPVTPQQRSVAQQQDSSATPVLASPSLLSPEQRERIRVNREAALRRRTASPEPGSTPPTIKQGPKSCYSAASKLFDTIGTKLPTVSFPTDRCVRCAGAMHAGACSEPKVNQVLYNAGCCACCALPVRCVHQSW